MPLPVASEELKWPGDDWKPIYDRYAEHAAWFAGDPSKLSAIYASGVAAGQFWRTTFDRFWARAVSAPQRRQMLHIPAAADIATVHSDILFSKAPKIEVPEKAEGATEIQDRIDEIVENSGLWATLAEGAENQCALGGEFIRVTWDKALQPEYPMLTTVDADAAVPQFRWGRLTSVIFWNTLAAEPLAKPNAKETWRLLECHEPGYISTGLYMGDPDHLGMRVPLTSRPDLDLGTEEVLETGIDQLTAVYVPNVRPNRLFRGSYLGRSDYDGLEALMDALDETWTSWMRDLRLARARLIVPQEFVQGTQQGKPGYFDIDKEIWEALPMPVAKDGQMITPSQFEIRHEAHQATVKGLLERIIAGAGYSGATFDLEPGGGRPQASTATEIINRERRSLVTRGRKINYWQQPLEEILEALLAIDAKQGFAVHGVARPSVKFSKTFRDDIQSTSTVAQLLRQAKAASTETLVRLVNPEWTDEQVATEVKKIDEAAKPPTVSTTPAAPPGGSAGPQNGPANPEMARQMAQMTSPQTS